MIVLVVVIYAIVTQTPYNKSNIFMKINFENMQIFDFNNLNLQEEGNNNCFNGCDCDGSCYSCD